MPQRRVVLGLGAAVGLLLAMSGAFVRSSQDLSGNTLARVNGKAITVQDLTFALERSASGNLNGRQRETLDFLIDQELLIQRGVEIGLLASDLTVRKAIAMAVVDTIVADVLNREPSEAELQAFYTSHQAVFALPARLHLQHLFVADNGDSHSARVRAEQAAAALTRGMSFREAHDRYGEKESIPVPDALLPPHVLRQYLGPTLVEMALSMQAGEISPPVQSSLGYHIVHLVESQPEHVQPYETVRQEVRAEYFRRQRDEALQRQLDRLRQSATIVRSPQAPLNHKKEQDG
jgi:parvulin-like peptidyl-prolyl isomerase